MPAINFNVVVPRARRQNSQIASNFDAMTDMAREIKSLLRTGIDRE